MKMHLGGTEKVLKNKCKRINLDLDLIFSIKPLRELL